MKRVSLFIILFILFSIGSFKVVYGWLWNRDMVDQPSIKVYEMPVNPPKNTLSVDRKILPTDRENLAKKLKNPVKSTEKSIENGKKLFMIYCSPCHGQKGKGNGRVSKKFVPPPDLTSEVYKRKSDGFIYATIKNGGAIMPSYGESMSDKGKWDVVNFIRKLQGK